MKKRVLCSYILVLLCLCLFSCRQGPEEDRFCLPNVVRETVYEIGADVRQGGYYGDSFIYLDADTEEVYSKNLSTGEARFLADGVSLLSVDETGICVVQKGTDTVRLITHEGQETNAFSMEGLQPNGGSCTALDAHDGVVVVTDGARFGIIRESDGKMRIIEPREEIGGNITSVCVQNANRLMLVSDEDGGTLYEMNLKNGKTGPLSRRTCVSVCCSGNAVYFTDGSGIYELSGKEENSVGRLKGDGELLGFALSEDTLLTVRKNALILSPRPNSANTLSILCADDRLDLYSSISQASGITTSSLALPAESFADKLNTRLLAGDSDFDIAVVSGTVQEVRTILRSLVQYHLYLDLGENETLKKHLEETYPGVLPLITAEDGKVFMLPLSLYYEFDRFDTSAEAYGVSRPDPAWTVDELWNVCKSLEGTGRSVFQSKFPRRMSINLLSLLYNELDDSFDFLDPDTLSSDAEGIILRFLQNSEPHLRNGTLFGENPVFDMAATGDAFVYSTELFGEKQENSVFGVFPVSSKGEKTSLAVNTFLFVNPNTKKKELALEFLAELTDETNRYNTQIFAAPLWTSLDRYYKGQPFLSAMSKGSEEYFTELDGFLPDYYSHARLEWADMPVRAIDAGLAFIEGSATAEETAQILYNELVYSVKG